MKTCLSSTLFRENPVYSRNTVSILLNCLFRGLTRFLGDIAALVPYEINEDSSLKKKNRKNLFLAYFFIFYVPLTTLILHD